MNKADKKKAVEVYREKFARAKAVVLAEYKGMTVAEITNLRDELRKEGIEFKVVKNTLARIASENTQAAVAKDAFVGPLGVVFEYEDPARAIKTILAYAKKNEKLKITCGAVDGMFCNPEQLKTISMLPSREVLLSMMAGTFQAPASQLARLLNATVAQLGYALTALKDKKAAA